MKSMMMSALAALVMVPALCSARTEVRAVYGTVDEIAVDSETAVVKAADGKLYTVEVTRTCEVLGFEPEHQGVVKRALRGVTKGSDVVVYYTVAGTRQSALKIQKVGDKGLKATEGTVQAIDEGARTVAVKAKDGTVKTYKLTEHATKTAAKDTAHGVAAGAHVVVYSSEASGHAIAHFVRVL
ncbi:hypothetical protein [Paludibaculum fermentans]|uniref:hypothetical protein n=1 Tax=Paludibaculum fermentans TaxID=1473598 RepID=UPI003EB6A53A